MSEIVVETGLDEHNAEALRRAELAEAFEYGVIKIVRDIEQGGVGVAIIIVDYNKCSYNAIR